MASDGYYDTDAPWICWWFLTTDRMTRITGRSKVQMECVICGGQETIKIKIPRFGPVVQEGKHPERARFILEHMHPDRGHPMSWAKPLRNLAAIGNTIDLDLLAMRLEADLRESS